MEKKPECQYGEKCYRRNPEHLKNYSHSTKMLNSKEPDPKKPKLEIKNKVEKNAIKDALSARKKRKGLVQSTLNFKNKGEKELKELSGTLDSVNNPECIQNKELQGSNKNQLSDSFHNKVEEEETPQDEKTLTTECISREQPPVDEDSVEEEQPNTYENNQTTGSWTYVKNIPNETTSQLKQDEKPCNLHSSVIRELFLVHMPADFYSLYEFCKKLNSRNPLNALTSFKLTLVGPYDVMAGKVKTSCDSEQALCHWRFFYDPPEFQTVLCGENGFHMGYWRDDPESLPVFVASNIEIGCTFKIEAENLFGAIYHYLENFLKSCDPFIKIKVSKLQKSIFEWAEKEKFTLNKQTDGIKTRQKKVVSKTFHRLGIVVPVEPKTEIGYRPLIETDAQLKKICKLIMNSEDPEEREALWENLQPLIIAANIANDECDFGNSLELGIDLFCMGSPIFHDTINHLLSTAYILLSRRKFADILKAHLKNRKSGNNLATL